MDWAKLLAGITATVGGVRQLRGALGEVKPKGKMKRTTARVNDIGERVGYIAKMAKKGRRDPNVRKAATSIVAKKCGDKWCVPEKDWEGEVKAVFAAVRENIRYTLDPVDHDLFQSVGRTVEFAAGDCDDYVIVLCGLLGSIGYPMKLRVVHTKDSPTWNHIYCLVGLPPHGPQKWVPLDASVNQPPGWEVAKSKVKRKKDFDL